MSLKQLALHKYIVVFSSKHLFLVAILVSISFLLVLVSPCIIPSPFDVDVGFCFTLISSVFYKVCCSLFFLFVCLFYFFYKYFSILFIFCFKHLKRCLICFFNIYFVVFVVINYVFVCCCCFHTYPKYYLIFVCCVISVFCKKFKRTMKRSCCIG